MKFALQHFLFRVCIEMHYKACGIKFGALSQVADILLTGVRRSFYLYQHRSAEPNLALAIFA
jgi:hypothetical protein